MKIGKTIKTRLREHAMTQKDLGEKLSLNQRTISSYCNNKSDPDLDTLAKMCKILDIDANELLGIQPKSEDKAQNENERTILLEYRKLHESRKSGVYNLFLMFVNILHDD